jgi:glycosyltransferase involved in cell wall biosynthesis
MLVMHELSNLSGHRIAIFHNLPSGGAIRALYQYIKRLSVSNNVDLYQYKNKKNSFELEKFANNVYEFKKPGSLMHLILTNYAIAKVIDNRSYDFVFIHHDELLQSPAILGFLKTKKIYYCQEPSRRDEFPSAGVIGKLKDLIIIRLDRFLARRADLVLCNSEYSKSRIMQRYALEPYVSYLGVAEVFYKARKDKYVTQWPVKILSAGRLHESKGHEFIIRSLGKVNSFVTLTIISDSADERYKDKLIGLAISFNLPLNLITVDEESLPETYSNHDIFCAGQHNEPFGLVVLEAISVGLPVVAVNEGGFIDIITNGDNGYLVDRNEEDFSRKVKYLCDSVSERQRIGRRANESSKGWSWEASYAQLSSKISCIL